MDYVEEGEEDSMHVIYDARVLAFQYTGLGRFAGELLFALLNMNGKGGIKYTVVIWENGEDEVNNVLYEKLRHYEANGFCQVLSTTCRPLTLSQHFFMKRIIDPLCGDVYFYPHFDLPIFISTPFISIIHDLFPTKVKGYITKNSLLKILYFRLMLWLIARRASYIFAVSDKTRMDLLEEVGHRFSGKIGVSLEGPIVRRQEQELSSTSVVFCPKKFILYVGDRRPHKNIKRIIDVFILLVEKEEYSGSLLLVGSPKNHDFDVESYINGREDIFVVGNVDDSILANLYSQMDALIFLSKYEGFGLPVVEAGIFNKKMIISDGGSLPDVAPSWAYILPNDAEINGFISEIGEYLRRSIVLDDDYSSKFTWESAAQRVQNKFIGLKGAGK
jgi:glycosyltransferase involved in cell wall biosynthesis